MKTLPYPYVILDEDGTLVDDDGNSTEDSTFAVFFVNEKSAIEDISNFFNAGKRGPWSVLRG